MPWTVPSRVISFSLPSIVIFALAFHVAASALTSLSLPPRAANALSRISVTFASSARAELERPQTVAERSITPTNRIISILTVSESRGKRDQDDRPHGNVREPLSPSQINR